MNYVKNIMLNFVAVGFIFTPTIVLADFKSDIVASCSSYQQGHDKKEINACKLYIDGFIDSSLLTEDAVIQAKATIGNKSKQQSTYLQRAYRTRVSDSSFLSTHKNYQFCIPREYNRKIVASKVAKSIDINQLAHKPLKEVLFETLIAVFPCSK
jgi:hypothetical protein